MARLRADPHHRHPRQDGVFQAAVHGEKTRLAPPRPRRPNTAFGGLQRAHLPRIHPHQAQQQDWRGSCAFARAVFGGKGEKTLREITYYWC